MSESEIGPAFREWAASREIGDPGEARMAFEAGWRARDARGFQPPGRLKAGAPVYPQDGRSLTREQADSFAAGATVRVPASGPPVPADRILPEGYRWAPAEKGGVVIHYSPTGDSLAR